ncbi:MAG: MFS transporter [Deltaproteobacteria bacterium]|nr:MFS transporter [Deltaproteobacteria bacterium]
MRTAPPSDSIWTRPFALLCLAEFLGYAQHFALLPTLPLYITQLGGSPFIVGLVIAAFGVTSVISRPIIGYWVDRWSETGVMVLGMVGQALSVLFCFVPFNAAILFSNALRGIAWSGMTAAGYTLLATAAPPARRGEANGYFGGVQSSATIIFPAIALAIIDAPLGGYHAVFFFAMTLVLSGAAAAWALSRATPARPLKARLDVSEPWWREILTVVDRHILTAALLIFTLNLSLPCFFSFVVLYARELGVSHFAWYYVAVGITSALSRPLLGRFSDRLGAGRSLIIAFGLETAGLLTMTFANNLVGLIVSGALWHMGAAIGSACIVGLAMESAPAERRGRAMASFSTAFPLSNGTGALINGIVVELAGYRWMFTIAGIICASGFLLIWKHWAKLK